jgi:hypothetical protein
LSNTTPLSISYGNIVSRIKFRVKAITKFKSIHYTTMQFMMQLYQNMERKNPKHFDLGKTEK